LEALKYFSASYHNLVIDIINARYHVLWARAARARV